MKTEREKRLIERLRFLAGVERSVADELDVMDEEHATRSATADAYDYVAGLIEREALTDEGSGGGGLTAAQKANRQAVRETEILRQAAHADDTSPQQRDALEALNILVDAAKDETGWLWPDVAEHEAGKVRQYLSEPIAPKSLRGLSERMRRTANKTQRGTTALPLINDVIGWAEELALALSEPAVPQHPDDAAVDRFATAMKGKLKWEREERGRGGWDDPEQCSDSYLATLLVEHLRKGNPGTFEDVANFAMMLHQRGAIPTTLAEAFNAEPAVPEAVRRLPDELRQQNSLVDIPSFLPVAHFRQGVHHAADELDRALAQSGDGRVPNECVWNDNGDFWESSCGGVSWYFDSGGTPQEHGMKYCYSCGRPLAAAPEPDGEKNDG